MAQPSVQEFWRLLAESGLVTADRLAKLQEDFAQMRGAGHGNAPVLAEWLISEKAITRFHSDVLLRGRAGPFNYRDFQVQERIGSGRLKGNYRAVHFRTQHPALLVFFSGNQVNDASEWASVSQHAVRSFQTRSPHLTCCHELVDLAAYKFASLENLSGRSLAETIAGGATLPVSQACAIAYQIALGLTALHAVGESHGDVRPDNIWLSDDGRAILLDFPLSRPSYATRAPLNALTVEYAAPEQHQLQPIPSVATDIYAIGCTLYQLLSGRTPFATPPGEQQSVPRKMARHASEAIVPLEQLAAVPETVNHVVSYMMAKNIAVRYQDAATAADALRPFVDAAYMRFVDEKTPARTAYEAIAVARRGKNVPGSAPATPPAPSNSAAPTQAPASPQAPAAGAPSLTSPPNELRPSPTMVGATAAAAATSAAPLAAQESASVASIAPTVPAPSPTDSNPQSASASPATPSIDELLRVGGSASATAAPSGLAVKDSEPKEGDNRRMKRSTKNMLLAIACTLGFIGLAIGGVMIFGPDDQDKAGVAAKDDDGSDDESDDTADDSNTNNRSRDDTADDGDVPTATGNGGSSISDSVLRENIIADDGSTLWSSPTQSAAPDLRFVAPGPQVVFMVQASAFFETPAGQKVLNGMSANGMDLAAWIQRETGFALPEIRRLDFAFYEKNDGRAANLIVVRTDKQQSKEQLVQRWQNPGTATHQGTTYWRKGQRGYYIPMGQTDAFTVGDVSEVQQVIDMLDEPAWLARPMEELRKSADAGRHVTVLFAPNYVRSARSALYPGRLGPLHDAVSWFLGPTEEVQAGMLSVHAGDKLFTELRLYGVRDKKPQVLGREFYDRLGQAPRLLNSHLLGLTISAYSRPILSALPDMLRSLHQYTRYDWNEPKGRQAVLRAYLPGGAGEHLAMATDLVLLESAGTTGGAVAGPVGGTKTVWEKLKQPTSLVFSRDNLINATKLLGEDLGVKIELVGKDLELEGITKNQSFGIALRDKPAEEILLAIVTLANPDKTVKNPSEAGQKLVYVVKEKHEGGEDVIWITTRAAAEQRGDDLPAVFKSGT